MSKQTYTPTVQVFLFSNITELVGYPNTLSIWKSKTEDERLQVLSTVFGRMVSKFGDRAPKTVTSLEHVIRFTLSTNSELTGRTIESQRQIRQFKLSAYEGGFLSMTEVLDLESK